MDKQVIVYSGKVKGYINFIEQLEDKYYGYTMEQLIEEVEKNGKPKT